MRLPLGTSQAASLKMQSLLASVQHALPPKATSCLDKPSSHGAAIFEPNGFVSADDLSAMVERASAGWAEGRRDEIVKMSLLHEAQRQLGWHHQDTSPEEYIPLNPLVLIDAALTEVANKLHTARGDRMESAELEAVSTCFQLEHSKIMMWVPLFGLPKTHFSKFVLDFCSRGIDSEVFESGLQQLMLLGRVSTQDEKELLQQESALVAEQRYNQDRWGSQKSFSSSADHSGADSRRTTERARDPGLEMTNAVKALKAAGTRVIAIAVEGTFVTGAVDDSQSVKLLRDKVSPLLNQAIVAAVAEGVQVALLSKFYSARTVQVLADSMFSPPDCSNIIVRCGGVRADLKYATVTGVGGHKPSEKLFQGSGKEAVVPGHVRRLPNHKQWNLESALASIRAKGIHVDKDQCLIIDSNQEDVHNLNRTGYRAFVWDSSCSAAALAV